LAPTEKDVKDALEMVPMERSLPEVFSVDTSHEFPRERRELAQ
jgi:hypothetical protein